MFRPDQEPLLPNWRWLPVGYHGRAGSVVVSGTDVVRPNGQRKAPDEDAPTFGPSRRLDFELEIGFVVGVGSELGEPVPVEAFADHVFGVVLVNDWSARDIQAWEYVPLGPFLGKSFQTSVSAWVTPLALLEDARVEAPAQEPPPLDVPRRRPRLGPRHRARGRAERRDDLARQREDASTGRCRSSSRTPRRTARRSAPATSWRAARSPAPEPGSEGSMIELYRGERFLADGDELVLRGRAANGVELGEVRGRVLPARVDATLPAMTRSVLAATLAAAPSSAPRPPAVGWRWRWRRLHINHGASARNVQRPLRHDERPFVVTVNRSWAPRGADRFYNLVKSHFYDNQPIFRVLPGFVAQWGISGNPAVAKEWQDATIKDDPVKHSNDKGTITFATSGPDSRTTQLFVNLVANSGLDSQGFSPFGTVTSGLSVFNKLYAGYGDNFDQAALTQNGASWAHQNFPKLDWIKTARLVQ